MQFALTGSIVASCRYRPVQWAFRERQCCRWTQFYEDAPPATALRPLSAMAATSGTHPSAAPELVDRDKIKRTSPTISTKEVLFAFETRFLGGQRMHPVLRKTIGGLSRPYYYRQLFFALFLAGIFLLTFARVTYPASIVAWLFAAVSTLLYPYSRFVYESVASFIMGDNIFFISAPIMLLVKYTTMFMCWIGSIFIAPIGLVYLYFHHSKNSSIE